MTLTGHIKLADFGLSGSLIRRQEEENQTDVTKVTSCTSIRPDVHFVAQMNRERNDEPTATTGDSTSLSSSSEDDDEHDECDVKDEKETQNIKWVRRKTVCGTAGYRPPEQVQERYLDYYSRTGYDERADWFSLGVCCYTMLTGRRPFPTKKELMQSDSQRKMIQEECLKKNVINENIMKQVMDDTEYQCLMFEVRYPSYFENEPDAKNFIGALLSRDPECRPRYDGIINHSWMSKEKFQCETLLEHNVPDWVLDHVKLNFTKTNRKQEESFPPDRKRRQSRSLSDCINEMCTEFYERNSIANSEAFEMKWTSKAKHETLKLFRHWNYMSDDVVKLETTSVYRENTSFSERLMKTVLKKRNSSREQ